MSVVELKGICHQYNKVSVLNDLSLQLDRGEVLGLFGHNGAGKTTTIKLILGILRPTKGAVRVLERPAHAQDVRLQVGYLPENVMFYPQLTGRETLCYFAKLKRASRIQVEQLLDQVGLTAAASQKIKTYSKGMRQRLGLAQALLGEPSLLLLDEPTVGLDPIATQELYAVIDELRQRGTSVILCSHVLPGVEAHINRAAILSRGCLQALGSLEQLREQAGLPIRFRCAGINGHDSWWGHCRSRGDEVRVIDSRMMEISTQPGNKLKLLRELVNEKGLIDLEIRPPSLEDLYRYFSSQSIEPGNAASPTIVRQNKQ